MKNLYIQVNKDEFNKDKKFSPKITYPLPELTNIQDGNIGLHLQVPRGGTHPNGVGSELTQFCSAQISFCYSWFRLQLIAIHCNRREVWTEPSRRVISRTFTHFILTHMHSHGSRCRSACLIKTCSSTCHHVSDCALSLHPLNSSSLSSVSTFCPNPLLTALPSPHQWKDHKQPGKGN